MSSESECVSIAFEQVRVAYATGHYPISADFAVSPGEKFAILGPSGSGKSTLIKVAAGLIRGKGARKRRFALNSSVYHSGKLIIGGQDLSDAEPSARAISLISQHSNLYPHLTVRQNLELAKPPGVTKEHVTALLDELGIGHLLDRRPSDISGGEAQRVALAKAMLRPSCCVAFDEPMSGLDQHLRIGLTTLIRQVHRRHPKTLLLVSHDQESTLGLADRVAFLHQGQILQISTPKDLVENPAQVVVASAIDPFFRVRLDEIVPTSSGFQVGPVSFKGPCLPTGVRSLVINTRKVSRGNGGLQTPGWETAANTERPSFVGGQAVIAASLPCSDSDWNIPQMANGECTSLLRLVVPQDGLFAFDGSGRRLKH